MEIHTAGKRAEELTRQLLAFSRQQVLQPRVVSLNEVVLGMERLLRRLIAENIELVIHAAPSLGFTLVDPGQVELAVMNLAVNSRDAMPGGGKLTIETSNAELDEAYAAEHAGVVAGPYVMVAVSDTGTGMDKATQARMFEPFFTTKATGKGTGLGLATVFGIVRQSGGSIWVYSELGKGTASKLYFPRVEEATAQRVAPAPRHSASGRGTETVLLVEDELQVRSLARRILTRHGYTVLEAEDGEAALELCRKHAGPIDALLTDVVMPRMSGRELAERLRAIKPKTKVLLMSGYTDDAIVRHGIVDSNIAFLQKPLTSESLVRKLREVLDGVGP
jgi:two-component system cell cycle sensor histidine kinase/response regulator CckA